MKEKLPLLEVEKERKPRAHKIKPDYNKEESLADMGLTSEELAMVSLSDEEVQFVANMVANGCNKEAAYMAAYNVQTNKLDAENTQKLNALMRRSDIKQVLRSGIQTRMSEMLDNLDAKLLDTYITRAFYDPADFIDDSGEPYSLSQIKPELRCVVDGVEKKYFGKDAEAYTITLKLANRDTALKTLSEYMGVIRPKAGIEITNTISVSNADEAKKISEMSNDELLAELKRLN